MTDWQPLTANDSYLVAASDGVFEKMSVQDVCDLLWEVNHFSDLRSECTPSSSFSLAEYIVNTAFEKGSMDNVAAVVVPLENAKFSANSPRRSYIEKMDADFPLFGLQELASRSSGIFCVLKVKIIKLHAWSHYLEIYSLFLLFLALCILFMYN